MPKTTFYVGTTHVGQALFAKCGFNASDEIAPISGDVLSDEHDSQYCMELGDDTVLEPNEPFCFLNHSCEPNCELIIWETHDESPELFLHALCPIDVGDELTIDYAWPAESAIPCQCNSPSCRGWIVDENELSSLSPMQCRPSFP